MGFEYQKRPERRREDEPILPPRGHTRRMSAKAAAKLIHAAKKSGAEVRHEGGSALEKPTTGKQLKSCPLCDRTDGPSAAYACPMCGQRASSALEKPVDSVQMKGAGTADAAERQADALGAKIGTELAGMSVGAGTLSPSAASVAERHVGMSLAGTELRNDAGANAYASSMGALAVTEGGRVSFAAGRLDGSTSAGRSLVGHELVHVAQQRAHGMSARQGFLGLGGDEGGEGGGSSGGGVMTGMGLAGPTVGGEGSLRSGPAATEAPGGGETVFGGTIGLPDGAEEYGVHGQGTVEVRVNENGTITVEFSVGGAVRVGGAEYGGGGGGTVTIDLPTKGGGGKGGGGKGGGGLPTHRRECEDGTKVLPGGSCPEDCLRRGPSACGSGYALKHLRRNAYGYLQFCVRPPDVTNTAPTSAHALAHDEYSPDKGSLYFPGAQIVAKGAGILVNSCFYGPEGVPREDSDDWMLGYAQFASFLWYDAEWESGVSASRGASLSNDRGKGVPYPFYSHPVSAKDTPEYNDTPGAYWRTDLCGSPLLRATTTGAFDLFLVAKNKGTGELLRLAYDRFGFSTSYAYQGPPDERHFFAFWHPTTTLFLMAPTMVPGTNQGLWVGPGNADGSPAKTTREMIGPCIISDPGVCPGLNCLNVARGPAQI